MFFFLSAELGAIKFGKIASESHRNHQMFPCSSEFFLITTIDQIGLAHREEPVSNDRRGAAGGRL